MINSNMRCIEIEQKSKRDHQDASINSNMRCIEIENNRSDEPERREINSNMRCIEILYPGCYQQP